MGVAKGLVLVAALLLASACSRDKDPYRDWKAPQMLDEGERLLRAGDLTGADSVFRQGLERAQKAGYSADKTRAFLVRMLYVAAAKGDVAEMEKLFARTGGDANPRAMDVRLTLHLLLLLHNAGKTGEAKKLAEKLAQRLAAHPPDNFEERAFYAVAWIVIDRLRSANVELGKAKEASQALVETLKDMAQVASSSEPIRPGLRRWITRYVDHLFDTERRLVAQEVADLVERIDQMAPPSEEQQPCLPLDPIFPALGCLAELK